MSSKDRNDFLNSVKSLKKKPQVISQMFDEIAPRYDLMNDVMSGFSHKKTRNFALSLFKSHNQNLRGLDLATGTGDFAFLMASLNKNQTSFKFKEIVGIDFSQGMLNYAKIRAKNNGFNEISFIKGDLLKLPFESNYFDVLTIGYAIRNVVDVEKALKEIYRVTKPGGTFICVEATPPMNKRWRFLIKFYFEKIVFSVSKLLSSAPHGYDYFIKSVSAFMNAIEFSHKMKEMGFKKVRWYPMVFGSVTIFQGIKY